MLNRANHLKGYALSGLDGEIGSVEEFYFDDRFWTIRYLVAETRGWLEERLVLISPYSLAYVSNEKKLLSVDLSKKQIEDSPSLDTDKPVSKQFEESFYSYYGWPVYWDGPYAWGAFPYLLVQAGEKIVGPKQPEHSWDPNLRSTHDVTGHHIQAIDGEIGHVEDFLIDESWKIRYLIINTQNWWPGKKVLISPEWIDSISLNESKVYVQLSRETIRSAPEYPQEPMVSREYEALLYKHYGKPGYWLSEGTAP